MVIREDLVASAIQFLQDPSVASSSVENRIQFLRAKNLTQEEIDAALTRSSGGAPLPPPPSGYQNPSGTVQQYYPPYSQFAWQSAPPPPPARRDWRDWFIMATLVGGVSYSLFSLGKRYVYPMVAPPTPERLEQDKKAIEEQFDKAFALVEQLSKDTEELKTAEKKRTDRLDGALSELEEVMSDLKVANRRREDDAQRIRDEVQALQDAIPKAMNNQKELADIRLREINTELTSLKTLVSQRVSSGPPAGSTVGAATTSTTAKGHPLRHMNGSDSGSNGTSAATSSSVVPPRATSEAVNEDSVAVSGIETPKSTVPQNGSAKSGSTVLGGVAKGPASGGRVIPAWQMAMANQSDGEGASGSH